MVEVVNLGAVLVLVVVAQRDSAISQAGGHAFQTILQESLPASWPLPCQALASLKRRRHRRRRIERLNHCYSAGLLSVITTPSAEKGRYDVSCGCI
jgi:hypothetical protein